MLPFHSYDSTNLYLIAVDAKAVSIDAVPVRACCQFERYVAPSTATALEAERFCSSFSILLGYIKLRDDVNDGLAIIQRVTLLMFYRRFKRCMNYFSHLDPEFENVIARILDGHSALERSGVPRSLPQYVAATGDGFSYLFALFASAIGQPRMTTALARLGRQIGEAICYFDVANDFFSDRR